MTHNPPCVDGVIMQNETHEDFEIVPCKECKKMEQGVDENDYDYGERLRHYSAKDN